MKITSGHLPFVRNSLLKGDFAPILEFARGQKRVLSLLTALTYDPDPLVSDGAVQVTGQAARLIAQQDPEFVRTYLRRLFWLANPESGATCWRAAELIGEILHACPQFAHFRPMLVSLDDLDE